MTTYAFDTEVAASPGHIMADAVEAYAPVYRYVLFSGGHDSLTVTHWAMTNGWADGVLHVNTGIGVEETREFVRETCAEHEWPLHEYHAPERYEDIVKEHGFPGPHGHRYMYIRLKAHALDQVLRDTKRQRHDHVMFITGVRLEESQRRMGNVEKVKKEGARIWVAPFLHMTKRNLHRYIAAHSLRTNPVVEHLHMSGECLCGAYAKRGELDEIALWYPKTAERIREIEREVKESGHPWGWEDPGPPSWFTEMKNGQAFLDDDYFPLCTACGHGGNE